MAKTVLDAIETKKVNVAKAIQEKDVETLIKDKHIKSKINKIIVRYSTEHYIKKEELVQNLFIVLPDLLNNYENEYKDKYDQINNFTAHFIWFLNKFLYNRFHDTVYKYSDMNFKKEEQIDMSLYWVQENLSVEDEACVRAIESEIINEIKSNLTPMELEVFVLHLLNDKSQREVAKELNMKRTSIATLKERILEKI